MSEILIREYKRQTAEVLAAIQAHDEASMALTAEAVRTGRSVSRDVLTARETERRILAIRLEVHAGLLVGALP